MPPHLEQSSGGKKKKFKRLKTEKFNYWQHRGEDPGNLFSSTRDYVPQPLVSKELIRPLWNGLTFTLPVTAAHLEVRVRQTWYFAILCQHVPKLVLHFVVALWEQFPLRSEQRPWPRGQSVMQEAWPPLCSEQHCLFCLSKDHQYIN